MCVQGTPEQLPPRGRHPQGGCCCGRLGPPEGPIMDNQTPDHPQSGRESERDRAKGRGREDVAKHKGYGTLRALGPQGGGGGGVQERGLGRKGGEGSAPVHLGLPVQPLDGASRRHGRLPPCCSRLQLQGAQERRGPHARLQRGGAAPLRLQVARRGPVGGPPSVAAVVVLPFPEPLIADARPLHPWQPHRGALWRERGFAMTSR